MAQKNNLISVLVIVFVFCLLWIGMFVFMPVKTDFHIPFTPSENERFAPLQQAYERNLERKIVKLLTPLVGRNKVQATAQLKMSLRNAHHSIQTYTPQNEKIIDTHRTWEKDIQNLIQQQHVSVIVDGTTKTNHIYQARTPQEMDLYKRLIQSAIGYDPTRGDTLEIQNMPFVTSPTNRPCFYPLALIAGFLCLLGIILIVLGLSGSSTGTTQKKKTESHFSQDLLTQIALNPERAIAVIKNWIYMPTNKKDTDWAPLQKVGIILLALDDKLVRQILVALDDNEVRQIAKTMVTLGVIPPQESTRILTELHDAMENGSAVVGNPTRVQQILSESTNEQTLRFKETLQPTNLSLWQELANTDSNLLAPRFASLKPEIIAYILFHLQPDNASKILENLPETKAAQVLIHLSHIGHVTNATNAKLEQESLLAVQEILNTIHTPSGTEKTTEILSHLAQTSTGQSIIKDLNEKEPFLARKLTARLIRFEDIASWHDGTIQVLLKNTLKNTATEALTTASSSVKKAIQRNVPSSTWEKLESEIHNLQSNLSQEQAHTAQQKMVETAQKLLAQGKIKL